MSIILAVTTNGRAEYLERTVASIHERLTGDVTARVIFDDSGDSGYRLWLGEQFVPDGWAICWPGDEVVGHFRARAEMWRHLARFPQPYVAGWEDDFTLNHSVNLGDLVAVLDANPQLAQVALLRDACYPRERKDPANEVLGWPRRRFRQGHGFYSHRLFFTCNPSVYRRSLCAEGWPEVPGSEKVIGDRLAGQGRRFAFFGRIGDPPAITHIGAVRAPGGVY